MPIQGKLKQDLTMDSILSKVSEFDIFKAYYPGNFELNQVCISPFPRSKGIETHPSFVIGNKYGHLSFIDYGDSEKRGDCFNFVRLITHSSTLNETLEHIDSKFGLGFRGVQRDYKKAISEYKQPEVTKRNTVIQVVTRKFTLEELKYWSEYHVDLQDLRKNDVYSIKTMYFNKTKFPLKDTELRFGYLFGNTWKIYRPFSDKKNKWLSNVPLQTSWGTENLKKGKNSLICKAKKDFMVCKKILDEVVGIQNESLAAFSEKFVNEVTNNSEEVFYGGDSDAPGKQASYNITGAFGYKHINAPDRLLPATKDLADWAKLEGLDALERHFKNKKLII